MRERRDLGISQFEIPVLSPLARAKVSHPIDPVLNYSQNSLNDDFVSRLTCSEFFGFLCVTPLLHGRVGAHVLSFVHFHFPALLKPHVPAGSQ